MYNRNCDCYYDAVAYLSKEGPDIPLTTGGYFLYGAATNI